ncbi:glycoprotease/Kae1 family metallohydrolase [Allomyces macrogynus ATCC 38327]|uniref:N(6)-L-threonylcarbamoyladenine synthase n=1 Tax=Allomyces macrogynus (strain ATCC 38327) TaxID=578462 RepID=A0A0L0S1J0_ALLM3|nr:glycoprotease/Kae1 family metallohydrolase [Allomyces macrogynus ATCC 38327]|eukprot:KNE56275.1 glycoprotease/Kae1 family metallohydrolase [Allomyces macrogynus ATCC 38327]
MITARALVAATHRGPLIPRLVTAAVTPSQITKPALKSLDQWARYLSKAAATANDGSFAAFTHLPRDRPWTVIGIETSCDDTSVAVVTSDRRVRALVTRHQTKQHEATGGIVPTAAAIAHSMALPGAIREALETAGIRNACEEIDAVAVTRGPGLAPKPLVGVHHMEAHALTPRLTQEAPPEFPFLSLLASGGHTLLLLSEGLSRHTILGTTLDDAVGEAFDKVARTLVLPWLPTGGGAGAALEQWAAHATGGYAVTFPVPMRDGRDKPASRLNMSFSGLKTSVFRHVQTLQESDPAAWSAAMASTEPSSGIRADIARAFQDAAVTHLADRLDCVLAETITVRKVHPTCVVAAGGVAANQVLRARLGDVAGKYGLRIEIPPPRLCTDNAAMIAWTGIERLRAGLVDPWALDYVPKWPLNEFKQSESARL